MKTVFFTLIIFLLFKVNAQDSLSFNKKYVAKNNMSVEVFGLGLFYSINYEQNFIIREKSFHTLRVGLSYANLIATNYGKGFYIPLGYTYCIGKKKSKFFIGTGVTFMLPTNPYPVNPEQKKHVRQYPNTAQTPSGQPYSDVYVPSFDIAFQPIFAGYELISKKRFFFKATASTLIVENSPIKQHYLFLGWAGFTFGFKLN